MSLLLTAALVLWTWLPGWAPYWVVQHSPWVEPVVRADVYGGYGGSMLLLRMDEWRDSGVPGLIDCLVHRDARVRRCAADAIGTFTFSRPSQYGTLATALDDPDEYVRRAAIECLGTNRNPAALTTLLARLPTQRGDQRYDLADAVGKAWRAEAMPVVVAMLTDSQAEVRANACMALGNSMDARAVDPLLALCAREPNGERPDPRDSPREAASNALARMPDIDERLIALLTDPDPRLRAAGSAALFGRSKCPRSALPALLRALDDSEVVVRANALGAIANIDGAAQVERLLGFLNDPAPLMRGAGIYAFRHTLKEPRVVLPLMALLGDSDGMVRVRAAEALGFQGDRRAVEPLLPMVDDPFPKARVAAINSLSSMGDVRAVEPLLRAMGSADLATRVAANNALDNRSLRVEREQRERQQTILSGWPKSPP